MSKRLVVALSGGVGGAKLALGLSLVLPAADLLVVANTGDDFEHLGLNISPDVDTLTYVLAGIDNPATGWGRRDETWSFMDNRPALLAHKVVLEVDPACLRTHAGTYAVVAHRHYAGTDAEAPANV